ncbi:MAG: 5-formyltetrahydrofolate cyclo-ligase [Bacteroidetes bacterium]|nr:5-formyltetrahydrofolate cyclo-ligase [Bacteroidota bacterium]
MGIKKSELRELYQEKRKMLSPLELSKGSEAIIEKALSTFQLSGKTVSLFLPIERQKEINTYAMWEKIKSIDGYVAIPKVNEGKNDIKHVLFTEHRQLKISQWGIPEPQNGKVIAAHKIDIVFVPLLCFDERGHRVGYGGGFYDRFLKKCRVGCQFIGLSIFDPIEGLIDDILPTDVQLNACVTPNKVYRF